MHTTGLFDRIDRPRRLQDEVASSILASIERKQLLPGDKLPSENELSKQFGKARTVIREAISLLKFDGVVDSRRGVGHLLRRQNTARPFVSAQPVSKSGNRLLNCCNSEQVFKLAHLHWRLKCEQANR